MTAVAGMATILMAIMGIPAILVETAEAMAVMGEGAETGAAIKLTGLAFSAGFRRLVRRVLSVDKPPGRL